MFDALIGPLAATFMLVMTLAFKERRTSHPSSMHFSLGYRLFWSLLLAGAIWVTLINLLGSPQSHGWWPVAALWLFVLPPVVHAFVFRYGVDEDGISISSLFRRKQILWPDVVSIRTSVWGMTIISHDQKIEINALVSDGILNVIDAIPMDLKERYQGALDKLPPL